MKHISLFTVLLFVSLFLFSQKTIENPKFAFSTASGLRITKIELTDTSTICYFEFMGQAGTSFSIPDKTYILPAGTSEKLFVTNAENISLNNWSSIPPTGKAEYILRFPKVDPRTESLDYGEANKGGDWFMYEIELVKKPYKGLIDENLTGYWFKTDGSKELILALFDTMAVYQCQAWKYGKVVPSNNKIAMELTNATGKRNLQISLADSEMRLLGATKNDEITLSKSPKNVAGYSNPKDKPYTAPVFTSNGQTTYKGIIRNFNPKYISQKTGQIHVNNVLTGNQVSHTVKIANDGTFSFSFPMAYPCQIYAQMPMTYESVFVEPGKETFHIIDISNSDRNLFMGELAMVNAGLLAVKDIRHYDYKKVEETILDLSPEQFKTYCFEARDLDLNELKQFAQLHYLSPKVLQIKTKSIEYSALSSSMEYHWRYEDAYRKKNNIPNNKRDVIIDIPKRDTSYYSFLNNDLLNNPLAPISVEYNSFVNRVKYLDILRGTITSVINFSNIEKFAKEEGIKFSIEEEKLLVKAKLLEDEPDLQRRRTEIFIKYQSVTDAFFRKHRQLMKELGKDESFLLFYDIADSLTLRGIEITPEEKEFLNQITSLMPRSEQAKLMVASRIFNKENGEATNAFIEKYKYLVQANTRMETAIQRDEKLKQLFSVDKGLISDIMLSQDLCRGIVEETTPMGNEQLKRQLSSVSTPFIADYVMAQNELTKAKLETNKLKTGYVVNTTPSVEADKLFDAMISKYKGKVVFVDFWATWCGPCRSGMERIKPLKEEIMGNNIVFLYITGPSSPEGTWKNMIPDIKGEHYRVSTDEWNTLCGKFGVTGIPHYLLVDKDGAVAKNNGMPTHDLNALKNLFEEFMAK